MLPLTGSDPSMVGLGLRNVGVELACHGLCLNWEFLSGGSCVDISQ